MTQSKDLNRDCPSTTPRVIRVEHSSLRLSHQIVCKADLISHSMTAHLNFVGRSISRVRSRPRSITTDTGIMGVTIASSGSGSFHTHPSHKFSSTAIERRAEHQTPQVKGDMKDHTSYILTLQTDRAHYESMKHLRNTYFPPRLNKIPPHITLFHALPGDRLKEQVIPAIEKLAAVTPPYHVAATVPFRLKRGIGIGVADDCGHPRDGPNARNLTKQIHERFRKEWGEWLSQQDSQPIKLHYTVMNKVEDENDVNKALDELKTSFEKGKDTSKGQFKFSDEELNKGKNEVSDRKGKEIIKDGTVDGLLLWKYEASGHWVHPQYFKFTGSDADVKDKKFEQPAHKIEMSEKNGSKKDDK